MKQSLKRFISRLLCLVMLLQVMPVNILAEGMEGALNQIDSNSESGMETYSATFNYADNAPDEQIVQAGESITLPDPGGEAVGWTVNGGKEILEAGTEVEIKGNTLFAAADANVWTVTFYNRDGEVHQVIEVVQGEAIGDQMPATIAREDYTAYWAVGTIDDHGSTTIVERIDSSYIPTEDTSVVPDYDLIKYTVTFYDENKATVIATKTVDANTSYCLNDIPAVPAQSGASGKWVYDGGDFGNSVTITADTAVWPEYTKNTFTVKFMIGEDEYSSDTYYSGDALELPADPVIEGKDFDGWYVGETKYEGGETITSDLTLVAQFSDENEVRFVVLNDDGSEKERLAQYFRSTGEAIGTMPEDPFVAGKVFQKWVIEGTDTEVTAETIVTGPMTVVAVFKDINIYEITAIYYYLSDSGSEVDFETQIVEVKEEDLPHTITTPSSTQTDEQYVSGSPVYYPTETSFTVDAEDFDAENKYEKKVQYVKYTAVYDIVHKLKDLTGDGYTEIDRDENVEGVLGAYVTPKEKTFDYANLEKAIGATIGQESGQELEVRYTRKTYALSYETNGGSYVAGTTAPYGSEVTLSTDEPTKDGYEFGGWYLDADLTQEAGSSLTLEKDTTVYAKWNGANVHYTIVYLFEKYNDAGTASSYVYDNSRDATGTVGSTVRASSAPTISRTGWEVDAERNASSSVVIAADGSSVLNVYYKLTGYEFHFRPGTYNYRDVTAPLNGESRTGNNNYSYTFTAKLGQDISSLWISAGNGTAGSGWNAQNVSFSGWVKTSGGSVYVTKRLLLTEDMLPGSGTSITYQGYWLTNTVEYTVNYMLQNADDDGYTRSEKYSQTYEYSNNASLSPKDIAGYTYVRRTDEGRTANLYYDRDKYQIDYFYGSTNLRTISNVKFDANISGANYNWTPTAAQCGVDSDYTFAGWYSDSGLTTKYEFTTMPASNLVVYAKWTAPSYTVSFVDDDGTTKLADDQTVVKYTKAERPAVPTKEGYTFEGWYTEATGGDLFDWNTQIITNTTVYAHWTMDPLSYTVHYVDTEGTKLADDKVVTDPNYTVGQVVTENAITIAGYRPQKASDTVTLAVGKNELTFIYVQKADQVKYTVKYLIEDTSIEVAAQKNAVVDGDMLSVIETAAAVDYDTLYAAHPEYDGLEFFPDEAQKELTLSATEADNVITFWYSQFKSVKVTINYVDMNGAPIPGISSSTQFLKVGKTLTIAHPPISGWEMKKAVEGTEYGGTEAQASYKITSELADKGSLEFTLFYQKKVTITAKSASKQYDGTPLTLGTKISDQVTLEGIDYSLLTAIDFNYANSDTTGGRLNAGICTVTPKNATITGNGATNGDYYKVRYVSGTLEVTKINVTVRVEPDRWTGAKYTGESYKAGFTNPSKKVEDYILISHEGYKAAYLDTIWNTIKTKVQAGGAGLGYYGIDKTDAGDYTYEVSLLPDELPQNDNYSVSLYVRPGRLQILPVEMHVKTPSDEQEYNGTALTNDAAEIVGLVEADQGKVTVKATGSRTDVGESENPYDEITWGDVNPNNYTHDKTKDEIGTLTVTKATLTITAVDKEYTYNGAEQGPAGTYTEGFDTYATVKGLAATDTLTTLTISGKQIDAGEYAEEIVPSAADVEYGHEKDADIEELTLDTNYDVVYVPAKLTINKAPLTITAKDQTYPFNNAPQGPAGTYTEGFDTYVTVEGLLGGDALNSITLTGKQTWVKLYEDEIVPSEAGITFGHETEKTAADNYEITYVEGDLEITQLYGKVTINKTWDKPADEQAPDVEFTVSGGPEDVKATLKSGEASVVVENLPMSSETGLYEYSVAEPAVDGYASEADGETTFELTPDADEAEVSFKNTKADAQYVVEFYYQNDDAQTYPETPKTTETREGKTGETVSVTDADKVDKENGKYTYDTAAANVESAELKADGTTVLKLYFKLNEFGYTIHHYLNNSTTSVADDETGKAIFGTDVTAQVAGADQLYDDYKNVVFTSYDPSQTITITNNAEENVITVYYVIPETVDPSKDESKFGTKKLTSTTQNDETHTFSFTLAAVDGAPMPAQGGETASVEYVAKETGLKTIPFDSITYKAIGEYSYTITESAEGYGDGWKLDTEAKTVTVSVTAGQEGKLDVTVTPATIENKYEVGEITVDPTADATKFGNKNLTSTTQDGEGHTFKFTLAAATDGAPMPESATAEVTYKAGETGEQVIPFGTIKYDAAGDYSYTITESDEGYTGGGWTLDTAAKTITVKVVDNGDGTLTASVEETATIENSYKAKPVEVDPKSEEAKTVFGKKNLTATTEDGKGHTFSFTLAAVGNAPMPESATASVEYAADATGNQTIPFGKITYKEVGEYKYTITEDTTNYTAEKGWTTGNPINVTVKVEDNGEGQLVATVTGGEAIENSYKAKPAEIDTSTDEGVIVVKKVEGEGFKPATFSFTLAAETEGAPMPESATAEATFRAAGSQNVDFGILTFEEVGTYTYTATETTKGETGDGWTYDNEAYGITIDVTDNGEGQLEAEISDVVTITNTYSSKPELTVEKKATSTPENGTAYQLSETVTYEISVTNTGNVTITDITVSDDLTGDTWTVEKLLPGEKSEAFKTSYTVVQKDVDAGKVLNVATAKGTDPGDKETPPAKKENEVPVQQKYTLQIFYRYLNGAEAAPTYTGEYDAGEAYSIESPVIENFTAMPEVVEGTMPKRDEVRYVFYVPTPPIIIPEGPTEVPTYTTIDDYGTPLGLGNITLTAGECFE